MKQVRCNHCNNEYYVEEDLDKLGFPLGGKQCEVCGESDYLIMDEDVKLEYTADTDDYEGEATVEDLRSSLSLLKEELKELIETYIDPWLK